MKMKEMSVGNVSWGFFYFTLLLSLFFPSLSLYSHFPCSFIHLVVWEFGGGVVVMVVETRNLFGRKQRNGMGMGKGVEESEPVGELFP